MAVLPDGRLLLRARIVKVMAMPVATGMTDTVPRSPNPASRSASFVNRFVSLASKEEPAACSQVLVRPLKLVSKELAVIPGRRHLWLFCSYISRPPNAMSKPVVPMSNKTRGNSSFSFADSNII